MANNRLSHPTHIEPLPVRHNVHISRVSGRACAREHNALLCTFCDCGIVIHRPITTLPLCLFLECLETAVEHLMEAKKGRTMPFVLPISCGRWAVATKSFPRGKVVPVVLATLPH